MKTDIQETGSVEQIKSRVSSNRMLREVIDQDVLGDQSRGNEIIKGVCSDSRRVVPGSAFFAIPGNRTNGELHLEEALKGEPK